MRRHRHGLGSLACLLATAVAMAGCSLSCARSRAPRERGELTEVEKSTIAAFTSGTISRESPIRVAFHEPLARLEQLGAPLSPSPFRFEPEVAGTAVWAAPDRIEFRPKDRLPDGQAYAASLDLAPLLPAGKAPLARFEFVFGTMRQSFDVSVEGLEATDASDVKRQTLTGQLLTADVEDAPGVEKLLKAAHAGRELAVVWAHDSDRRVHRWSASGIERGEAASVARVSWDGGPIGVDKKDGQDVSVPGLDTFTVAEARAVAAPEPHVELRFTDPLKAGQNLKGLLRIANRDDLRFVVDGSRVEIYGSKGWRGKLMVRVETGVRNVLGYRMKEAKELDVLFEQLKPAVRFAGKGVIVPTSAGFTVPIETVNLPPPYRSDCRAGLGALGGSSLSFVSPREGAFVFVPRQLDGTTGRVVFEAAHRDPLARVFWHLDDEYQGETVELHQMALAPRPGAHRLVLVEERGESVERRFTVVERTRAGSASLPGGPVVQLVRTAGS